MGWFTGLFRSRRIAPATRTVEPGETTSRPLTGEVSTPAEAQSSGRTGGSAGGGASPAAAGALAAAAGGILVLGAEVANAARHESRAEAPTDPAERSAANEGGDRDEPRPVASAHHDAHSEHVDADPDGDAGIDGDPGSDPGGEGGGDGGGDP